MADNLTTQSATPATVPSASVIATDDVTGVHFQKVKLDVGGDGVSVPASGDATYGLDVDVTRVAGNVAVTGSFYPATQAVDITANSVLLATAAKQPALGTAGTASTDVITVQGISGGTPQPVSISSGSIGNTSFVATQTTASSLKAEVVGTGTFAVQATPTGLPMAGAVLVKAPSTAITAGGTATVQILPAPGAGLFNYVTSISIANSGTVSSLVLLYSGVFGSGGTVVYRTMAPALGGSNITFPTPLKLSANEMLSFSIDTTPSGSVYASAVGYTGA